MAGHRPELPSLGAALSRQFHPEILTPTQKRIFAASGDPARRWGAYLAGGTTIALHFGHRLSEDFDWFTPNTVAPDQLIADVGAMGFEVELEQNTEGTFLARLDGVKFSLFRYRYPLLEGADTLDGCALASLRDLAAMKLAAICGRATKKDYVDIHALLTAGRFSLADMLAAFCAKFPTGEPRAALQAVGYFGDVEKQTMPPMLGRTTWKNVKDVLTKAAASFDVRRLEHLCPGNADKG